MTYVLKHKESAYIQHTCQSFPQAQREYYGKMRELDGSIPWQMFYDDYELDVQTGSVIGQHDF